MSGLIKFKFGFENLLKNSFEKFEKEKEKGNFPLRAETFPQPNSPACLGGPSFPLCFSPRPPSPAWAELSRSRRPSIARARFPASSR
jgi:hypothetical protein